MRTVSNFVLKQVAVEFDDCINFATSLLRAQRGNPEQSICNHVCSGLPRLSSFPSENRMLRGRRAYRIVRNCLLTGLMTSVYAAYAYEMDGFVGHFISPFRGYFDGPRGFFFVILSASEGSAAESVNHRQILRFAQGDKVVEIR